MFSLPTGLMVVTVSETFNEPSELLLEKVDGATFLGTNLRISTFGVIFGRNAMGRFICCKIKYSSEANKLQINREDVKRDHYSEITCIFYDSFHLTPVLPSNSFC